MSKDETSNRNQKCADWVYVRNWIKGDATKQARRIVTEFIRHPSVRGFVR
jgi:hypothetical protein